MVLLAAALLFQALPVQHFSATPVPGTPIHAAADVDADCGTLARASPEALLTLEDRQDDSATGKHATERIWRNLACTRAELATRHTISHAGWLMPQGTSWTNGAIAAALRVLAVDSTDPVALRVLATVAFSEQNPGPFDSIVHVMQRAVAAGVTVPIVLRACDDYAIRLNESAAARRCAERGLALGRDSTWHLLRLARLAFRDADTVQGAHDFYAAIATAHDSLALDEAAWHIQWFVSPDEMQTWDSLPLAARATWIHSRLLARDVRDGQPTNARIAEHFHRLEYVLANFQLALPDVIRRGGGLVGSTPEDGFPGAPEAILGCHCDPSGIPAYPFRFYHRWQTDIDDRGMVWMRFGKPDIRIITGAREGWVYNLDTGRLTLNFEGEAFDGTEEATRLVEGVLGEYMCDYDAWRCGLTGLVEVGQFRPEHWQLVKVADRKAISEASTTDDNAPRGLTPISADGHFYRLLDPTGSGTQALIAYRLRLHDLATHATDTGAPEASFQITIRQLNSATDAIADTSFRRHVLVDSTMPKDAWLDGVIVLPSTTHATTWSLVAEQDGRRGRVAQDGLQPLAAGALQLSDLILGSEASGLHTTVNQHTVYLPPAAGFSHHDKGHLYYQIRSATARGNLHTTLAFFHTDRGSRDSTPALQIRSSTAVHAGFNVIDQGVSFAQLSGGPYRLRLTITGERGLRVEQETAFIVR